MNKNIICIFFVMALIIFSSCFCKTGTFPKTGSDKSLSVDTWSCFKGGTSRCSLSSKSGPVYPQIAWTYSCYAPVDSSPVITKNGNVIVGSNDQNLYCLSSSGKLVWKYHTDGPVISSGAIDPKDNVIFASGDGYLYKLNPEGRFMWKTKLGGEIFSSPLVNKDMEIIIGANDGLYRISSEGAIIYHVRANCLIDSSPAMFVANGNEIICTGTTDGKILTTDRSGKILWSYSTGSAIISTPAVTTERIFVGSDDNFLYALDTAGNFMWKYKAHEKIASSPAITSDSNIVIGSEDGNLYCFDNNGKLIFTYYTGSKISSSPSVDKSGNIYVGGENGMLYGFNSKGKLLWSKDLGGEIFSCPALAKGILYIGCGNGKIYAIGNREMKSASETD